MVADLLWKDRTNTKSLDLESIRREGIDNVEKFLRDKLPGLYFLEAHVVTTDYVNKLTASTQMKLDTEGWAAVGVSSPLNISVCII